MENPTEAMRDLQRKYERLSKDVKNRIGSIDDFYAMDFTKLEDVLTDMKMLQYQIRQKHFEELKSGELSSQRLFLEGELKIPFEPAVVDKVIDLLMKARSNGNYELNGNIRYNAKHFWEDYSNILDNIHTYFDKAPLRSRWKERIINDTRFCLRSGKKQEYFDALKTYKVPEIQATVKSVLEYYVSAHLAEIDFHLLNKNQSKK